jgi:hypothetical protein
MYIGNCEDLCCWLPTWLWVTINQLKCLKCNPDGDVQVVSRHVLNLWCHVSVSILSEVGKINIDLIFWINFFSNSGILIDLENRFGSVICCKVCSLIRILWLGGSEVWCVKRFHLEFNRNSLFIFLQLEAWWCLKAWIYQCILQFFEIDIWSFSDCVVWSIFLLRLNCPGLMLLSFQFFQIDDILFFPLVFYCSNQLPI